MTRRKTKNPNLPTEAQAAKFDMLSPMMDSLHQEMREFSKKKQDGIVNPLKVKMINRLLRDIKELLASDPSVTYLELLDEETLPQNSDAVLILGQFRAAMDQFKSRHHGYDKEEHKHRWFTQENPPY